MENRMHIRAKRTRTPRRLPARTALHAGIALTLALAASAHPRRGIGDDAVPAQVRAAHVVTNCDDSGPGSLREAAQQLAVSGDTIDLSQLSCSQISLSTGAIAFGVNDLTFIGPDAHLLTISAGNLSPVIAHVGSGTVVLERLRLTDGYKYSATDDAPGGCIYSQGDVVLVHSWVTFCEASATAGNTAKGGGVFAAGNLTLVDSVISHCIARSAGTARAIGGGAWTGRALTAKYSTLFGNEATGWNGGGHGSAGAAVVYGDTWIRGSAIAVNNADRTGGLDLRGYYASGPLRIANSTISGNTARGTTRAAGLDAMADMWISNSTIANNRMLSGTEEYPGSAAGMFVNLSARITSSIIAGNLARTSSTESVNGVPPASTASDLGGHAQATILGDHNLVVASTRPLPPDTLRIDPLLNNLALIATTRPAAPMLHPFRAGSPAVDAGSNPDNLAFDQRGSGYARTRGATTDIGAYEQDNDRLFMEGFEAMCHNEFCA